MKSTKKVIYFFGVTVLIGCSIVFFGIRLSSAILKKRYSLIKDNLKVDTCIISKVGNLKGNYILISFSYKEKVIEGKESVPSPDYYQNERYIVEFDSTNPSNFFVRLEKPVVNISNYIPLTGIVKSVVDDSTIKYCYTTNQFSLCKFERISKHSFYKVGDTIQLIVNKRFINNSYFYDNVFQK